MEIKYSKLTVGQLIAAILLNVCLFLIFYNAYSTAYHIEQNPFEVMNIR
jgi:hypothetical protein